MHGFKQFAKQSRIRINSCNDYRAVETDGILVDDELSSDLQQVVDSKVDHEPMFGDDEFKRIFWDQQVPTHAIYSNKVLVIVDNLLMLGCCM